MCSARDNAALPALGVPIRASAGQRPFSASPRLIAAVHALHRLLVPRHPPCALTILTVIVESRRRDSNRRNLRFLPEQKLSGFCPDTRFIGYCAVFKVREEACTRRGRPGPKPSSGRRRAGLSKLNSMRAPRGELCSPVRPARSGRHSSSGRRASGRPRSWRAP